VKEIIMPFKSEAQRGWMHANEPEMAKKWEKETPKGKKLPKKVKKKKTKSESIDKIIDTALVKGAGLVKKGTGATIDCIKNPAACGAKGKEKASEMHQNLGGGVKGAAKLAAVSTLAATPVPGSLPVSMALYHGLKKKKTKSESIDKIIDTALAEAEIKRQKRSFRTKSSPSDTPSFYMSSKNSHPWYSNSPKKYIATGISADHYGDAGQGSCLDVDLISTLSKKFTKYAMEYADEHGYEIVPDENGSLRGDYCGGQLTWPIKRPDKARREHFESRLNSILEDQNCILTVLSEDYDDYEKGEDWSADEDQSNFHDIDSVVPVTRLPHGVFAYKGMDETEAEYAIGQRTIPRFVAISDNNHIKCASWCPSEQIVYKFQIPNLSEKSPQPISVVSWYGDCTAYPKGMPAVFHNNQYERAAPSSAPEHYDELVISVPCVVVDKYEPIGEDGNDFLFRNSNGDELIWSI
jgi:hypothetical protein